MYFKAFDILVGGCLVVILGQAVVDAIRSLGCPYGWRQFGQSCYTMVTDTPLNWYEARQVCLDAGSDLAVPNSKTENDFIWNLQKEVLENYTKNKKMWLGCDDQNEYNFMTNQSENTCTVILASSGKWADRECSSFKRFLCERNRCISNPLRCFTVNIKDSGHQATPYCLGSHTYKETLIQNPNQCCLACSKDPNCHSFNLSGKMCQLNNVTISQVDADKYLMENCVYYEYE